MISGGGGTARLRRKVTFAKSIVSSASLRNRSLLSTACSDAPATPPPPNLLPTRFCGQRAVSSMQSLEGKCALSAYLLICGGDSQISIRATRCHKGTHPWVDLKSPEPNPPGTARARLRSGSLPSSSVALTMTGGGGGGISTLSHSGGPTRYTSRWVGRSAVLPQLPSAPEWLQLSSLTISMFGMQLVWSCETGQASPLLLSLGVTKSSLAIVLLAGEPCGPITPSSIRGHRSSSSRHLIHRTTVWSDRTTRRRRIERQLQVVARSSTPIHHQRLHSIESRCPHARMVQRNCYRSDPHGERRSERATGETREAHFWLTSLARRAALSLDYRDSHSIRLHRVSALLSALEPS